MPSSNRSIVLIPVLAALVLAALWMTNSEGTLVVYCSHDAVYARQILDDFTRQSGIRVHARFDTEATKSLGLINLIVQERNQPRCDVFWNNELLGMVELQEQGLLEPYRGSGWERIPPQYRDADGYWVGFGARMRVSLFNINQVSATEETLDSLLTLEPDRVAMAKPLFGTTLTHYTVLWHLWGADRLKAWHRDLHARGLREVDGNAAVKDVVVMGTCDAGLTDNDDAFVALDERQSVQMLPVRLASVRVDQDVDKVRSHEARDALSPLSEDLQPDLKTCTICIPNTVAVIKGTKHHDAARRLVDFLTSARTELALAKSKARQIPLGPVDRDQLPHDVGKLAEWSSLGIDLRPLLPARRECLKWLKDEYLQ